MIKIYLKLKVQSLKTAMEYTLNFWLMVISGILIRGLMLVSIYIIYKNIPSIKGFHESEIYLTISFMLLSEGVCNIMFDGIWHLTDFVFTGQFDTILVKPISPLLQVLSQEIGLQGIGLVTLGIYILFSSLKQLELLNFFHIFFSCIFFITGVVFRLSIYIIGASSIFYLRNTPKDPLFAIYSLGDNAIYPLSIYPTWMRIILLLIFPFGFIGYIPIIFFKTQNMVLFIATIIFAFFFILLARYVYYKGIRRYESAGT